MRNIVLSIALMVTGLLSAQVDFFEGSFEEAKAYAAQEGKPLFIDFYADWCMPCKQMEKYGFRDEEFSETINEDYVAVKVDVDQFIGMDIAEAYGVSKYPTIIITDSRGKELRRREGYQSIDQLNTFALND